MNKTGDILPNNENLSQLLETYCTINNFHFDELKVQLFLSSNDTFSCHFFAVINGCCCFYDDTKSDIRIKIETLLGLFYLANKYKNEISYIHSEMVNQLTNLYLSGIWNKFSTKQKQFFKNCVKNKNIVL